MSRRTDSAATAALAAALRGSTVTGSKLPLTRLAAGEKVRIGVLSFRGFWTGAQAEELEGIKQRLPGVSWVRLGGPGAPWTRELPVDQSVGVT